MSIEIFRVIKKRQSGVLAASSPLLAPRRNQRYRLLCGNVRQEGVPSEGELAFIIVKWENRITRRDTCKVRIAGFRPVQESANPSSNPARLN